MERINKFYMICGLVIASGLFFGIAANADEMDEATTMTFSAPVQIPGRVLPAGSYLFKLADTEPNLNMVRIFNADGAKLYGTVEPIPAERLEPTGDRYYRHIGGAGIRKTRCSTDMVLPR
jgi:hypothetical protein